MLYTTKTDYSCLDYLEYEPYVYKLNEIFEKNNVSVCHGINHAIQVMLHAMEAIKEYNLPIESSIEDAVILAGLLHDADDGKFFPNNHNNENLRLVLENVPDEFLNLIIRMVNLVSGSKNGDNIPDDIKDKEWMIIPRYADRLEALGIIGVERCYIYGKLVNSPLCCDDTPKAKSIDEIWMYATEERYNNYKGKSKSMIDHYYDKLIRMSKFPIRNSYLDMKLDNRLKPMYDILLLHGQKGTITDDDVINYIKNYKE